LIENKQQKKLLKLANQFRIALESCPKELLPTNFKKFPRGACGVTCLLLAKWLEENGEGDFYYVSGRRGKGKGVHSHAWLERNGTIVDITADQFQGGTPPVYVGPPSAFHKTFRVDQTHEADFENYNPPSIPVTLREAYQRVKNASNKRDRMK